MILMLFMGEKFLDFFNDFFRVTGYCTGNVCPIASSGKNVDKHGTRHHTAKQQDLVIQRRAD